MEKKTPKAKPEGYNKPIPGAKESESIQKLKKPTVDEMRKSESSDTISTGQSAN